MNSGQGVNYEVSGCVLITAESDAVPVYQSLAGIVFCFRIITSRADTPRCEEICAREIVKSHDDSLEARIFEFVCLRVEFLSVYALSPDAASWYT